MKLNTSFLSLSLFAFLLSSASVLEAQYVFTPLDILGSDKGGTIAVSGSNVVISFVDDSIGTTSFLYSAGGYTLVDDVTFGPKTLATGIDGSNVVGCAEDDAKVGHGFLYSGGAFTILSYPGARHTAAISLTGSNVVGTYQDTNNIGHGFLYNGGNYTPISYPSAAKTAVTAISGSNIVGTYSDSTGIQHGFIYNGGVYTPISYPGAVKTSAAAVSGNNVIGVYQSSPHGSTLAAHGFLYNGGTYTPITYPGSYQTLVTAISGNIIVGTYILSGGMDTATGYSNFETIPHGFTYNISTAAYTTLDMPGARRTVLMGISGNNIVGAYEDTSFINHGFLAVPSTKTLSLGGTLAFGNVPTQTSTLATLTITNTGTAPVTISGISYPTGFSGAWSGALAPGNVENVTVTFAPTAAISYSGNITVTSNATTSPNTIAVSGTGRSAGQGAGGIAVPVANSPVTYSQWAAAYAIVSAPSAMSQNDAVPNLLKYVFDINPTAPMTAIDRSALPVVAVDTTTDPGVTYLKLSFRKNALATGVTVNLQTSTDIVNWTTVTPDINEQTGVDATTGDPIMEMGVNVTGLNKEFIRLNVTSP